MSYMKTDFDSILRQYGHDIYLQRRLPDDGCGASYSAKYEIHTVRYSVTQNLSKTQDEQTEGVTNTSERTYYFRKEAEPFEGDRVYEYDPRVTQTVWELDNATMMRGVGGQVEFYEAGATRVRPN